MFSPTADNTHVESQNRALTETEETAIRGDGRQPGILAISPKLKLNNFHVLWERLQDPSVIFKSHNIVSPVMTVSGRRANFRLASRTQSLSQTNQRMESFTHWTIRPVIENCT
eukprot:1364302-Amorphochlora_amoeboformis.AAC.1